VNRFFNKKNLAFTLAEMMVILTLFSVISAATLPVITAKNNMDMSESSTASGYFPDPWKENLNGTLSYYDSQSPFANKGAVIVGGKVADDAFSLGYPQLIVKNNITNNQYSNSQILLTKQNGNNAYIGGRIMMTSPKWSNYDWDAGALAIGYEALGHPTGLSSNESNANPYDFYHSIGIGNYAGYLLFGGSITKLFEDSIAIGSYPAFQASTRQSVLLGNYAGYSNSASQQENVVIGNYAGSSQQTLYNSVVVGSYAGYGSIINHHTVSLGTYAGANSKYDYNSVNIGHFAGYGSSSFRFYDTVNIGNYAGYNVASYHGNYISRNISIGHYAGSNLNQLSNGGSIYIGDYAGMGSYIGLRHAPQGSYVGYGATVIGTYAGYYSNTANSSSQYGRHTPILIGYMAGATDAAYDGGESTGSHRYPVIIGSYASSGLVSNHFAYPPDVVIGAYAGWGLRVSGAPYTIMIGTYAGAYANSLQNSVCLGSYACYGASGSYDVRIGNVNPKVWSYYDSSGNGSNGTATLRTDTSYIGYANALEALYNRNYVFTMGNNTIDLNPLLAALSKEKIFKPTSLYSNLVLSPFSSDYNSSQVANSSIILYAQNVYGPPSNGTGGIYSISDRRVKENIKPLKYGLKDIKKVNIYEYKWKDLNIDTPQIGVIAQELQKIMPESIHKMPDGYLTVSTDWLLFGMFKAVQELDKTLITIQDEFKPYVKECVSLVSRVRSLEKEVKQLEKENKSLTKDVNIAYRKAQKLEARQ